MATILSAEKIVKRFHENETVLNGVDLSISPNSFNVILGASGSGKTTLLNIMSGLLKPTSGKVFYNGSELTAFNPSQMADLKRNDIGHIFQSYLLLPNLTAGENIRIGMTTSRETSLPFDEITEMLGIDDILHKFPSQLSGGQQQRVSVARAIIKNPKVLFCDEATGALDEENSRRVIKLLHSIKQRYGVTVVFITHNLRIADTAERIITMKDGLVHQDRSNKAPLARKK
ncbi:putative ABC transport system ATP-binding protein [Cohnella sp. SGD-V74]|uniref:ABC transporter ATP-binding protein n=1 Tax=unclassified Cohnella TaxID=2636738 RepID=UPI000D43A986|nr:MULTISPECIES: ABC transporter ATP-binding protein [unclassified Cohnella]PRX63415.1 putative ABC transport system ATP-binding protein [Cohnella sp. SGD-V74]